MYKTILKKVKELGVSKNWFIIGALFILTIAATVFFIFPKNDDSVMAENQPTNQIQVLVADENESENHEVKEVSTNIKEDFSLAQAIKEVEPQNIVMKWPGQGEVITDYGYGHSETFNDLRFHFGIDIALPPGYEVRAALPGKVVSISSSPLWGYEVVIQHGDNLETRYKGIKPVKEEAGYSVEKGAIIGQVVTSPEYEVKMNPHLHFEVYEFGETVDPMKHL